MKRDSNGRFIKGEHWREPREFRNKEWLIEHYHNQQMSTGEIAKMFGVTDAAILFWLRKHNILRRNASQARAVKYWGLTGESNPMFGKNGKENPNWKGGITAERALFYQSQEWKRAMNAVFERDKFVCQRCLIQIKRKPHIHHIISFSHVETRSDINNLIILCADCHRFIHSKRNVDGKFLQKI